MEATIVRRLEDAPLWEIVYIAPAEVLANVLPSPLHKRQPVDGLAWWDLERHYLREVDECLCCGKPGHYFEMLADQVRLDGQVFIPICVSPDEIHDGTHRLLVAAELGLETVPLYRIPDRWAKPPAHWDGHFREYIAPLVELGHRIPDHLGRDSFPPKDGIVVPACDSPAPRNRYEEYFRYLSWSLVDAQTEVMGEATRIEQAAAPTVPELKSIIEEAVNRTDHDHAASVRRLRDAGYIYAEAEVRGVSFANVKGAQAVVRYGVTHLTSVRPAQTSPPRLYRGASAELARGLFWTDSPAKAAEFSSIYHGARDVYTTTVDQEAVLAEVIIDGGHEYLLDPEQVEVELMENPPRFFGFTESGPPRIDVYPFRRQAVDPDRLGGSWIMGPNGQRRWGKYGAAGLLLLDPSRGILLQCRAFGVDQAGTWSIPGGALYRDEPPAEGALREASEEIGLNPTAVRELFKMKADYGFWSYTTVAMTTTSPLEMAITDTESTELRWVPVDDVASMPDLHPDFAIAWGALREPLLAAMTGGK